VTRVVLDTTVFHPSGCPAPELERLLKGARDRDIEVLVPEVTATATATVAPCSPGTTVRPVERIRPTYMIGPTATVVTGRPHPRAAGLPTDDPRY
jgi:hypothetical protein